ncbi:N-terminal acetyltransferase A, auxiliary subunit [Calocera viscosa TUFC12733]|uniref:N-terminal acetyltransferase A, auxiliary subunit n=1 Tax=Calocera viscosa (strain TUFC12733) TaxID=1330018 RepID=A0A167P5Y0_CALVF|nr:N-terminal acetyltransferase A, auxiliary subunit [Calocera viscosa TUFC12733]
MSTSIPPKRVLPQKEAALFRTLLQMYETKLYKKGVKTADTILKKFPEHGETLCMKGLILHSMDRREEGLELIRKGVRLDLTSHIVWHVYGIAHKSEKNYEETLKCYLQALKFDKENLNILREAAQLQLQLRHYEAHVESRNTLLRLRPQLRQNWFALAIAYYLNGDDARALAVLQQFEGTLKNIADGDVELSDILLFHVKLLEAQGDYATAIALLEGKRDEHRILDRVAIRLTRARLLGKVGRVEDARDSWSLLLQRNPDSYDHYRDYLASEGLSLDNPPPETKSRLLEILDRFASLYPRASAPRRLALDVAEGDTFRSLVAPYVVSGLRRGSPSLFSDIKTLYRDDIKRAIVEDIVLRIREELAASNAVAATPQEKAGEAPTTYLWTVYFLSQHFSYLGRYEKALAMVNEAMEHTPALPEILMMKARILKRAGDTFGAAEWMEKARRLDGQDRFLNGKCAKYLMRSGNIDAANKRLGLFTKKDSVSPGIDLEEMQSVAYLQQEGDAWLRQNKLGRSLKRYHNILKIFDDFEDDQFDFYAYSLRKFTFNAYLELLAFEDRLRGHSAYISAATAAAKIYLKLHDGPESPHADDQAGKHGRKKKRPEASTNGANSANGKASESPVPSGGADAEGRDLLSTKEPLQQAYSILSRSDGLIRNHPEFWVVTFDVALRRAKYLQAARALQTAKSLHSDDPEIHVRVVEFTSRDFSTSEARVAKTIERIASELAPRQSLEQYNAEYLQRHPNNPPAILAAARALHLIKGAEGSEDTRSLIWQLLHPECIADVKTCLAAFAFIGEVCGEDIQEEFRKSCSARFPLATIFLRPKEQEDRRKVINAFTESAE